MFEALFRIAMVVETDQQGQRVFPVTKNRPAVNETEFLSLLASVYQEQVYPTLRAEAVGLDLQQYTRDMAERRALARIEEDVEGGERSGVQGTPTFFINGVLYRGSWEQDTLLPALQAASRRA